MAALRTLTLAQLKAAGLDDREAAEVARGLARALLNAQTKSGEGGGGHVVGAAQASHPALPCRLLQDVSIQH